MFKKFGEFDSVEELNAAAEGFLKECDEESLLVLAEENGIDKEDAQDYLDAYTSEFATVFSAAMGRLAVQEKEIKAKPPMEAAANLVILNQIRALCTEPELARAVMRKGKRVAKIYETMGKKAKEASSAKRSMVVCCGTDRELEKLIYSYFTKPETEFDADVVAQIRRSV